LSYSPADIWSPEFGVTDGDGVRADPAESYFLGHAMAKLKCSVNNEMRRCASEKGAGTNSAQLPSGHLAIDS